MQDEKVDQALKDLAELGERGQLILLQLEQLSDDLAAASDVLLEVGGHAKWSYQTKELRAYLDVFVMIAKQTPSSRSADSGAYRKYKSWLHTVSAICGPQPRENAPLNDRQQRILQRVAAGEGWRKRHEPEGRTDSYSRVVGARMKRNPAVAKAIAEIREAGMKAAVYDLALAMKEAEEVIEFAKKHKSDGLLLRRSSPGASSGLLVDRIEVATVDLRGSLDQAKARVLKVINGTAVVSMPGPSSDASPSVTDKDGIFSNRGPGKNGDPFNERE